MLDELILVSALDSSSPSPFTELYCAQGPALSKGASKTQHTEHMSQDEVGHKGRSAVTWLTGESPAFVVSGLCSHPHPPPTLSSWRNDLASQVSVVSSVQWQ